VKWAYVTAIARDVEVPTAVFERDFGRRGASTVYSCRAQIDFVHPQSLEGLWVHVVQRDAL
jgi:hypothetical protein